MRRSALAIIVILLTPIAHAQEPAWQAQLADEIALVENCELRFVSQVVERTVDGRQIVMAKAHCADERVFDVWRDDPLAPFTFKECPTSAARTTC
jgi:hypothetical protein